VVEIKIVKAQSKNAPEIAEVFASSRRAALPYLPELHTQQEQIDYFVDVVLPENEVYLAAEIKSGNIAGFIAFTKDRVNHLYLLPIAQRQGLGTRLLKLAKDRSQALDLWTFQKNLEAQEFYKKHGFKIVKATDGSENEEKEPDVLLRWERRSLP
jgi:putative acetyltransferase